ncbi:NAD(+) diphosphatase [Clostridium sediminicola]|uniref:NAD(+) diphosphatase n=1 Tax=Clostridium sediminicola TaxID=3114879 RepID=UPI0031F20546
MHNNDSYINFVPETKSPKVKNDCDLFFIFDNNNNLLIKTLDEEISILTAKDILSLNFKDTNELFLGKFNGLACYTYKIDNAIKLPSNFQFLSLRALGLQLPTPLTSVCARARKILNWRDTNQFCGRCGNQINQLEKERAMKCPKCGLLIFPKISPAIIVAVTKDDALLMAHNNNFREGLYSVIAGFVEPGETFEECVKREVYEETSIKVKDIKYFGSQPWPYPDSLMVAFTANYESGDINVDGIELGHADWFKSTALPMLPPKDSIARSLIDNFISNQNS